MPNISSYKKTTYLCHNIIYAGGYSKKMNTAATVTFTSWIKMIFHTNFFRN